MLGKGIFRQFYWSFFVCLCGERLLGNVRKGKIESLSSMGLKLFHILPGMPVPWNKQRVGLFRP